jgi:hypothetical protein
MSDPEPTDVWPDRQEPDGLAELCAELWRISFAAAMLGAWAGAAAMWAFVALSGWGGR